MPISLCAPSWADAFVNCSNCYEDAASFYSPEVCFADAHRYLGKELQKRGRDSATGLAALDKLSGTVRVVDRTLYGDFEQPTREFLWAFGPPEAKKISVAPA